MTFCINCGIIRLKLKYQGGDKQVIWYDMSYNQFEPDFLNKIINELEDNEVEDVVNEFDETNTPVFHSNRCVL